MNPKTFPKPPTAFASSAVTNGGKASAFNACLTFLTANPPAASTPDARSNISCTRFLTNASVSVKPGEVSETRKSSHAAYSAVAAALSP